MGPVQKNTRSSLAALTAIVGQNMSGDKETTVKIRDNSHYRNWGNPQAGMLIALRAALVPLGR